jgi:hypothetical protein
MGITPSVSRASSVARRLRAAWIAEVVLRQQHLRDGTAQAVKGIVIERHQSRLADCCARLYLSDHSGPLVRPRRSMPRPTAPDETTRTSMAIGTQRSNLLYETAQQAERHAAIRPHDHVGSEFDNDAMQVQLSRISS